MCLFADVCVDCNFQLLSYSQYDTWMFGSEKLCRE